MKEYIVIALDSPTKSICQVSDLHSYDEEIKIKIEYMLDYNTSYVYIREINYKTKTGEG